jgi:hypothetical protein
MKSQRATKASDFASNYLNEYILVGGIYAPRWAWMKKFTDDGLPITCQNYYFIESEGFTREEVEDCGIVCHTPEEIVAIFG